jgi:hypothetical protein
MSWLPVANIHGADAERRRAPVERGGEDGVGSGGAVGQPEPVVERPAGTQVVGQRVDEEVDEEPVGRADAAVGLRHDADELADLGLDRVPVVRAVADVDQHRAHRLDRQLARDRHLRRRVHAERQVPPTATGSVAASAYAAFAHGAVVSPRAASTLAHREDSPSWVEQACPSTSRRRTDEE